MSEYHLKSLSVSNFDSYPNTLSGLISFLANVLYFDDKIIFKRYVISDTNPTPITQYSDGIWFKLNTVTEAPDGMFRYTGSNWERQSFFVSNDMVLVPTTATVSSPWGDPGQVYNVITYGPSGTTTTSVTAGSAPTAPAGFKYKVYVGNY